MQRLLPTPATFYFQLFRFTIRQGLPQAQAYLLNLLNYTNTKDALLNIRLFPNYGWFFRERSCPY